MGIGQEIMDELIIQDALLEERLRELVNNKCWETADNHVLKISDMKDDHLINSIRWLERNPRYYFSDSFITLMKQELERRDI